MMLILQGLYEWKLHLDRDEDALTSLAGVSRDLLAIKYKPLPGTPGSNGH